MPIFRRKPAATDPRPAIADFWAWWGEARVAVAAALADRDPARVAGPLSDAVHRIDPGLQWELAPGQDGAEHALVVSAGGNAELRALAHRWWLAAPRADTVFEYHPSRRRDRSYEGRTLVVEDYELPLAEFVAGTRYDDRRNRLDLAVHHPLFTLLEADARSTAAFLALDAALGEDDVERFVGAVDVTPDAPVDAVPLVSLGPLVEGLRGGSDGGWVLFEGRSRRGRVVGTVRRPFSRVDRPLADTHVAVELPYPPGEQGLPTAPDFAAQVARWEAAAVEALGDDPDHVVLVGHETGAGRCLVHLYVDRLEVDPGRLGPVLAEWALGRARVRVTADPAWREIGHLLS